MCCYFSINKNISKPINTKERKNPVGPFKQHKISPDRVPKEKARPVTQMQELKTEYQNKSWNTVAKIFWTPEENTKTPIALVWFTNRRLSLILHSSL